MPRDANGLKLNVGDRLLVKLPSDIVQGSVSAIEHPGSSISTPNGPTQPLPGRVTIFAEITFFWNDKMDMCQTAFKLADPEKANAEVIPARH